MLDDICVFFRFVTIYDKRQKLYFDWEQRVKLKHSDDCDSYSYITSYYKVNEERAHKWQYNPFTQKLVFHSGNKIFGEDKSKVLAWCKELDFKTIVKPLIIKPIVDPRKVKRYGWSISDMEDLKEWSNVYNVICSDDNILLNVQRCLWNNSLRETVCHVIEKDTSRKYWIEVRHILGENICQAILAYISSFFDIPELSKYHCCVRLWERGFIPSFDGNIWRIHQGKDMKVIKTFDKDWNEICQN